MSVEQDRINLLMLWIKLLEQVATCGAEEIGAMDNPDNSLESVELLLDSVVTKIKVQLHASKRISKILNEVNND